uniref:G protein-coupled receptor 97 n=3 Tax=Nothobranchius pienaari TaxID=704102 RepID=A0A1A8LEX6_9TELE
MMWITLIVLTLCVPLSSGIGCENILSACQNSGVPNWIRCYEDKVTTCSPKGRSFPPGFSRQRVNSSEEAKVNKGKYSVHIPSSALRMSRGSASEKEVTVVATVINSTLFKQQAPPRQGRKKVMTYQGAALGGFVLFVKAGSQPVKNLFQPVRLIFQRENKEETGTCVFWQESENQTGAGYWSTDGCHTDLSRDQFNCSCNHLSFFAVLVNPDLTLDETQEDNLSLITYFGSGLSAFFSFVSLFIYARLHRRRPEKAIGIHVQLTLALFCLHLGFLLCSFLVQQLDKVDNSWVCRGLGLFLHWSLLATCTWLALEGFHLYLLLVRVFNLYVRKYLLKLSLVGWGLPTLLVIVCGSLGVYGKYVLKMQNSSNHTSTSEICWMSSEFPHRNYISYITVAFLFLVVLCNSCMLTLVVFKLKRIRGGTGGYESSSDWKKVKKEKWPSLWKNCITVLGLSCVLGLPWALASTAYISLPGIYIFTIFNSLQGWFMFMWSVALSCKAQSESNSDVRTASSQKMMTTSFNN